MPRARDSDAELALTLASSLQPLWLARGRVQEGLAWFDAVLANDNAHHAGIGPVVRARALADKALLDAWVGTSYSLDQAEQTLAIARECGDPALVARALTACGASSACAVEVARPFLAEAIGVARALGDRWRLSQILGWQAFIAIAGRATPSRSAPPVKRDATPPMRSATGSPRVCVGGASLWLSF